MTAFFRFPHTPHLAWLSEGKPRDDKVLSPHEAREILSGALTVEEKVDGANLGFSVDSHGELRAQNRGSYLDLEAPSGQWKPLKRWLLPRRYELIDALGSRLILFGEWCFALHSVRYSKLPDWFLAFDVYDREKGEFWNVERRDELTGRLGLKLVPKLGNGRFDLKQLMALLGTSRLTDGPAEGLYVRRDERGHLVARAKLVRPQFVQAIEEHWSKRAIEPNSLSDNARVSGAWH